MASLQNTLHSLSLLSHSLTRFVCVHDSILVNSQGNTPERLGIFYVPCAQVRPVLQHLKIHTHTASQRSSHDSCISSLLHTRECVDSFALFLRSFFTQSAPFCVFFPSYSELARESERRAHLFIVLIYGNNFICRKAAGNIPRER